MMVRRLRTRRMILAGVQAVGGRGGVREGDGDDPPPTPLANPHHTPCLLLLRCILHHQAGGKATARARASAMVRVRAIGRQ